MAAPAFVAVATTDNQASSTSWVLTTPTHSVGDLLVAGLYLDVDPVTITPPAGWTLKHQQECATLLTLAVFFKIAGASEPSTFTFTLSTAAVGSHLMASYSGVDQSSPVEVDFGSQPPDFSTSCGAFAAQQAPNLTTTVFETRVLTFMLGVGGTGWTPDVKTTERADMRSLSAVADGHLADFVRVSPGSISFNGAVIHTYSVAGGRVQITIALKSPVPTPTTPITFVDLTEEASGSHSVTWVVVTPTHSVGDILVVAFTTTNSNMNFSLAGWTLVAKVPCTTPNSTLHVLYKVAGASEPSTFAFSITSDSFGTSMMASYSGVDTVTPVEADIGEQPPDINASCIDGGSPSQVVPGLTTTVPDTMMLTFIGSDGGDQGWTPDAAMQARADIHGFMDSFFAEQDLSIAGATGTRTHVFSATKKYVALMMALRAPIPAVEALQSLPLESLATRENPFLLPMDNRRGVFQNFQLPMDFLSSEELEVKFFLPMAAKQGVEKTIVLPLESDGTFTLNATQFIPISALATLDAKIDLPVDSEGVVAGTIQTPVEFLEGVAAGQQIPVEFLGTIQVNAPCPLPIEALAAAGEGVPLPIEAGGLIIINATQSLPIEALALVAQQVLLPMEAGGLDSFSVIQTFNVFRRLSDPLLHEFIVVPSALLATIEHSFNVDNIIGGTIDHSFRVLPDLVPLFTVDIQRPFGKADKT